MRTPQYPEILHHGAVTGTTGSCHELVADHQRSILIDCGLFQGRDIGPYGASADNLQIDFDISRVQALVVTHVHIDHVGRIPWLLAAGFDGPIYCSEPSAKLLPIVLEDAFRLSFSRQPKSVERYIRLIESRLRPVPYNQWQEIFSGLQVRLQRAGHILGSAYVECRSGLTTNSTTVVFSGDLGAPHAPILPAPRSPHGCDILVIESTYGDKNHENRKTRRQRLEATLRKALQDQGTVLIPAFSIGRTQELLFELEDIIYRNASKQAADGLPWNQLPIILDSPLASRFTEVYRKLTPFWEAEALQKVLSGRNPLQFDQLLTVDSNAAHQKMVRHLADSARPAVVISASGMCTGGRIVNYLKAMLDDPRHNVLLVGYQAAGTLGRQLQHGARTVDIDGDSIAVRAPIETMSGYSAHADQAGLLRFIKGMKKQPKEIRVVHGDPKAQQTLRELLQH
ncbi:MBL fold metallo-hydrolase RNA specificity domain-containing protein [Alcanivorax sp. 1008]|uniref:MBL fold metallo-hydrolase RNA specificity domain-containing protein n=1 Tax=Alcanivorax sp. 1008 TaxID=2816853 RepID=UPI001D34C0AD|nr:MBL fold metallo-hydrolase [Alcanivorax sp. 1008]MCC1495735.1 MBL fold metallo-hydrolase [Alcanivorax sp. 1008]